VYLSGQEPFGVNHFPRAFSVLLMLVFDVFSFSPSGQQLILVKSSGLEIHSEKCEVNLHRAAKEYKYHIWDPGDCRLPANSSECNGSSWITCGFSIVQNHVSEFMHPTRKNHDSSINNRRHRIPGYC
jgi:hypothetical protein